MCSIIQLPGRFLQVDDIEFQPFSTQGVCWEKMGAYATANLVKLGRVSPYTYSLHLIGSTFITKASSLLRDGPLSGLRHLILPLSLNCNLGFPFSRNFTRELLRPGSHFLYTRLMSSSRHLQVGCPRSICWVIPRSYLGSFISSSFDIIRHNFERFGSGSLMLDFLSHA